MSQDQANDPAAIARGLTARFCACGKRDVSVGIRQDHLGRKHWFVHNYFECYEVKNDRTVKRVIKK